ncbi:MAG: hypothetical protein AAGG48_28780 [Planctomycetota bacterium]
MNRTVIAGSGYDPATRTAAPLALNDSVTQFAASIAEQAIAPCDVHALDVCDCEGDLRLVEFNPFGGADLYACDADAIIGAVSELATELHKAG